MAIAKQLLLVTIVSFGLHFQINASQGYTPEQEIFKFY